MTPSGILQLSEKADVAGFLCPGAKPKPWLEGLPLDLSFPEWNIPSVTWEVEYTDEFGEWWDSLSAGEQASVDAYVQLLERMGPTLPHPYSSGVRSSRHAHMRELRVQHGGDPYRVLYAFDPRRTAILLIGGRKAGDERWYERFVPIADRLYDEHVETLEREGLIDG